MTDEKLTEDVELELRGRVTALEQRQGAVDEAIALFAGAIIALGVLYLVMALRLRRLP